MPILAKTCKQISYIHFNCDQQWFFHYSPFRTFSSLISKIHLIFPDMSLKGLTVFHYQHSITNIPLTTFHYQHFITNNIWELSGMPLVTHMGNSCIACRRNGLQSWKVDGRIWCRFISSGTLRYFSSNSNSFTDVTIYVILNISYTYSHVLLYLHFNKFLLIT